MSSIPPTFTALRALHSLVGEAIDDIQRVFSQPHLIKMSSAYLGTAGDASPIPTISSPSFPFTPPSPVFPDDGTEQLSPTSARVPVVDYPSPDKPVIHASLGEQLAAHPDAAAASMRIVAACGQISNIVRKPFLSLYDALLAYNLPTCLRLVEHLHIVEILREAEDERYRLAQGGSQSSQVQGHSPSSSEVVPVHPSMPDDGRASLVHDVIESDLLRCSEQVNESAHCVKQEHGQNEQTTQVANVEGVHVADLARIICTHTKKNFIDPSKLAHALRLLSAHHLLRETAPDTFALTRVTSLLDTGKSVKDVFSSPETKYEDTNGIAALVGMYTDELFKSAPYLTEAFTGAQLSNLPTVPLCTNSTDHSTSEPPAISTHEDCTDSFSPEGPSNGSPRVLTQTVEANEAVEDTGHVQPVKSVEVPRLPVSSPSQADCQTETFEAFEEHNDLPAFKLAFHTDVPFFEWLETSAKDTLGGTGVGAGNTSNESHSPPGLTGCDSSKSFRLERFSKAMTGTLGMEVPGAILSGFDWLSLPNGSIVIDVGGGIGSTTMVLARAFDGLGTPQATTRRSGIHNTRSEESPSGTDDESQDKCIPTNALDFRFVVQDRPAVVGVGLATWRSQCPDMLESGRVVFQGHDFFEPQPPLPSPHPNHYPAVFILRIVLHDWPDDLARRILVNLRRASGPETKLLIADYVVPLGCVDEYVQKEQSGTDSSQESENHEWTLNSVLAHLEGAERVLAMPPLVPNLGKVNSNVHATDLLMHVLFNGKERTLREHCALGLSAGWRVARVTRSEGSMFSYLTCVPIPLPQDVQDDSNVTEAITSTTAASLDDAAIPTS